jgi:hypothetical protein
MAFDAIPTGVRLLPDLVTAEQESALVAALDARPWEPADGYASQQFGWWRPELVSDAGDATRFLGALPDWAEPLVRRLHILAPFDYAPDHLVARDIRPGAQPQLRKGEGRTVATLALLSDLPVMFRRREGTGTWHLTQARRSLLVLTDRFDTAWDRTILPSGPARPGRRLVTLTFRRMIR